MQLLIVFGYIYFRAAVLLLLLNLLGFVSYFHVTCYKFVETYHFQAPSGKDVSGLERSTFALFMQPDWYVIYVLLA